MEYLSEFFLGIECGSSLKMKIAVQLYTLRTLFEESVSGTLDALSGIGFKNVELAGHYGLEVDVFARELSDRNLNVTSAHVGMEQFDDDLGKLVALCEATNCRHLIVPWIKADDHGGWKGVGEKLTRYAKAMESSGIKVGYHNHDFEFEIHDGVMSIDLLWQHADEKHVFAELDLYWVAKAGESVEGWLEKFSGNVPFTHFKDMKIDAEFYTEVGSGRLNWKSIIPAAEKAGVQYAIIEHDEPEIDPMESVKRSREYLLSCGLLD